MKLFQRAAIVAVAATSLVAGEARAQDVKKTARETFATAQKAVVTAKLVINISIQGPGGGRDEEQKVEVTGTVIDPSGLTVVSASAIDPTSLLKAMFARMQGDMAPKIESDVSETHLILEDGSEIEADVVLKDVELDLAFIKPRATDKKFDHIALKARGKAPEVLEDVFTVDRLGRNANRAPAIALGHVTAHVKGPRSYSILSPELNQSRGCVAFGADGATLGVLVVKVSKSTEGGDMMSMLMGGAQNAATVILRSVEDVLEIAEQAKVAKLPEKKKKEPKADEKEEEKKDAAPKKDGEEKKEAPKKGE